jgi:Fic family protein
MKLTAEQIRKIKDIGGPLYLDLKMECLYHSNKIEGSSFSREELLLYLEKQVIKGEHKDDDIIETINSARLMDFLVDTLGENLSERLIIEYQNLLMQNTNLHRYDLLGYKKIPNKIAGATVKVNQPYEVKDNMERLLKKWNDSKKDINAIAEFHLDFETIHPFQDGNGRVGRFIILKQCIENNIELIIIDEEFEKAYKQSLDAAREASDICKLVKLFETCQKKLDKKLTALNEEYLEKLDKISKS